MSGRVLVTGASGFIGRPLVSALSERGLAVVGASRTRPADIGGAAAWIETDLLAGDSQRLVAEARAETLVHLAWVATPGVYADALVNTAWLAASADLAATFIAAGGRRIVGVGSCLEYDVGPLGQRTLYGACKNACRLAFERAVAAAPDASLAWARVFFLLGAGDHESRFAPSLVCTSSCAGEPAAVSRWRGRIRFHRRARLRRSVGRAGRRRRGGRLRCRDGTRLACARSGRACHRPPARGGPT